MTNEELKIKLNELFPDAGFEESTEWLTLLVEPANWKQTAKLLRSTGELDFDYLFCLTGVDWKTHLMAVYHLTSTQYRHTIVVKSKIQRENPEIDTVADI